MRKLPTGEPCAGEPHARFGGRGRRKPFPTPYQVAVMGERKKLDSRVRGNDDKEKVEFESTQANFLRSIPWAIGVERNRDC